jgi:hypothetical protein
VNAVDFSVACAFLLGISVSADAATDRQTRAFPLPPGRTLSLEITIGDVSVHGWSRSEVELEIVRRTEGDAPLSRIPVDIEEGEQAIRVRAVQQDGGTDPSFRTDVTLRVPERAELSSIRIVEGKLTVNDFNGRVTGDVRRGPITASNVSGVVRVESGIGDVVIDRARLTPDGLLRLRAFNGDVRLSLAERPRDARILALALNGTVTSAIPLAMKNTWGPRWGEATLGRGEPLISIDVVMGSVEIRSP